MNDVARLHTQALRAAAASVLALFLYGCVDENGLGPAGLDPEGATIMAQVVVFDRSAPSLEGLTYFEGTVTLEGIDVELWDGTAWGKVVDQLPAATLTVGDVEAAATLVQATDIATGDYSRVRLVAARGAAALSLTVDGQRYGAEAELGDGSVVFEGEVDVVERDGVHMFRIGLETVTELARHTASDGTRSVLMTGDLGGGTLPLTAVVASDGSAPAVEGLSELEGKVVLAGITVELWDGLAWLTVVQDLDAARLEVGEILTPTPLLKGRGIPAGTFSRFRLSARRATAELALELNEQWFGGEVLLGEDVVVEDDLDVFDVHGAQLFWIVLEAIGNVTEQSATDGSVTALVEGDLGSATLRLRSHPGPAQTAIVASDGSDPEVEGLDDLEGKVLLEGVSVELWNGTAWRAVVTGLEEARLKLGEIEAAALLAALDELPQADYSRARLSVRRASARLAMDLGDHRFGGEVLLGEDVVVEKELEVLEERGDHAANVLWIVLQTIVDVTRQTADDGSVSLLIKGDLGSALLPPLPPTDLQRTALVVSDASDPEVDGLTELAGKVMLQGVAVELWNGTDWRTVVDHLEAVRLEVGEAREPALLLLTHEIPGDHSRARLSIRRATARLGLELGDRWFGGEALLGEEIVVEAELEIIDKDDHDARVFWIVVETVTEVTRQVADDGTVSLLAAGDFGSAVLPEVQPHHGVRFEVIERVHTTGPSPILEPLRAAVRSADEWERFWNVLHAGTDPRPDLPRIDFEEHMVVVAAMGERTTGGYAIEVADAFETDRGIAVKVLEVSPGPNCAVPQVVTAPVTAIILRRMEGEVEFVEMAVRREC